MNILEFDTLPSTSTYARENADKLTLPSLIIANSQTAGRGRRGNSFFSPKKTGLYMTLLFEANGSIPLITPAAAVAVCNVLERKHSISADIKWVNDIFLGGKKVCGILSECFSVGGKTLIAVGIGINLSTEKFPDNLPQAGSLGINCGKTELARDISEFILRYTEKTDEEFILSEYEKRLFIIGKTIAFHENNRQYSAVVKGINKQCNLIVELPDKSVKILSSGEISIIL